MSIQLRIMKRETPPPMTIINLDPTTKAIRLHDHAGRTVELGVVGANSSVLFLRYGGSVYVGFSWVKPDHYDADGQSQGSCGTPLHKVVEFIRDEVEFVRDDKPDTPPSLPPLAYFTDLDETRSPSLSLRLIFRSPFLLNPTAELFIEQTVDFHRMPAALAC